MSNFGSYEMPIYFSGIKEEHLAVRNNVGIFDVSHMSFISVIGKNSDAFLNQIVTIDIKKKKNYSASYSVICNENAGIIDDIIIYKIDNDGFFIVSNSENGEKVFKYLKNFKVENFFKEVKIIIEKKVILALQGPNSIQILKKIFPENYTKILNLDYYYFCKINEYNKNFVIARTGYTGEIGFEIILPLNYDDDIFFAINFWKKILEYKVIPCGLGARDVLRLEAGYPLYGNELSDKFSPIESGLNWVLDLDKKEVFCGKEILKLQIKNGINKKIIGLDFEDKKFIPRHYNEIFFENKNVGFITSGTFSFFLNKIIALGYLDSDIEIGSKVEVLIRNKKVNAKITKPKFYYNSKIKEKLNII
jgi:aminomethyltransferase